MVAAIKRFFGNYVVVFREFVGVILCQKLTILVVLMYVKIVSAVEIISLEWRRSVGTEPTRALPSELFLKYATSGFQYGVQGIASLVPSGCSLVRW